MRYLAINFTIALFMLSISITRGQKRSAPEWAPIGATWHYQYGGPGPVLKLIRIESVKDTLIHGTPARLLRQTLLNDHEGDEENLGNIFLRQINGSVFYLVNDSFHLLYNFDAKPGDTLRILNSPRIYFNNVITWTTIQVDSVFTIEIDGQERRGQTWTIDFAALDRVHFGEYVIEGVGSFAYLIPSFFTVECDNLCPFLNCYTDEDIFFHNTNLACDTIAPYIVATQDKSRKSEISVSPNPTGSDQSFKIHISDGFSTNSMYYSIFNINGMQVAKKRMITKQEDEVQAMNLPKGVYFIIIESKDGQVTKKLMIF
ncbi:MAG: T9SS type A sorting domain-containing protein [Saprospiraceae bacterium]|nr:T9SS type A sorting domain-containing protein [Saprospiraceae bacterium]